jgi:uncharacterized protein (TIGR02186 family)
MRAARVAGALCVLALQAAGSVPPVAGSTPPAASSPAPVITLALSKAEIRITAGFHGDILAVTGTAPTNSEVILRLSSPAEEETLDLKGKRGPLWLTVGKVRFESAPRIYKLRSTRPIGEILPPAEQVRQTLGVEGLKASLRVQPGVDAGLFASELLRLKRDDGFYDTQGGGVIRGAEGTYRTEFRWPARGPSGAYRMDAFAVSKGAVTGSAHREILVQKVGAEAWISHLAAAHGLIYGLLAVLLALLTGLAASALFGRLGLAK